MEGRRWGGRVWIGAGVCSDRAGEMAERREWWDGVTGGWMGLLLHNGMRCGRAATEDGLPGRLHGGVLRGSLRVFGELARWKLARGSKGRRTRDAWEIYYAGEANEEEEEMNNATRDAATRPASPHHVANLIPYALRNLGSKQKTSSPCAAKSLPHSEAPCHHIHHERKEPEEKGHGHPGRQHRGPGQEQAAQKG